MKRSDGAVASEPRQGEALANAEIHELARSAWLERDDRAALLRFMAMMRAAEERGLTLYRQGKIPGSFYDGCGQEAISVGSAFALAPRGPDVHPPPRPRGALRPRPHP